MVIEPELLSSEMIYEIYQPNIAAIKHQLGRSVNIVYKENEVGCPNCFYDGVNKTSTNRYRPSGPIAFTKGTCPYCKGIGMITQTGQITVSGNINYTIDNSDDRYAMPGGKFDDNDGDISFLLSECYITEGTFSGQLVFDVAQYLEVHGQRFMVNGSPKIGGLGEDYTVLVKIKRTNK
ncbi:MAG TPA: hypothetical protein PKL04_00400 [Methanofastidiosum sp.]|nr:hypothetical protein [Methanofastidiosum sp.]